MTFIDDKNSLQTYLETGSSITNPDSDSIVILFKTLSIISTLLTEVQEISTNKATTSNQTNIINRLESINTSVSEILDSILNLDTTNTELVTNTADQLTQLIAIKTQIDNIFTQLLNGDIKLNTDQLRESLLDVVNSLAIIENKLYGLHPTDGINGAILQLLTDIRNKLVVELVEKPTEVRLVLTDKVLVSNPMIKTISLDTANVQYSTVLPIGTRRFSIKSRMDINDSNGIFRYAYVDGIVANSTPIGDDGFYTVGQYVEDVEDNLVLTAPLPLYFASDSPGVVVVVKYWGEAPLVTTIPRSTPYLKTLTMVTPDTQYIMQVPSGTKKFTVKCRDNNGDNTGIIRAAYVSGIVADGTPVDGSSYTTIQSGNELIEENLVIDSPLNIYLASSTSNIPVTLEYWL